MGLAKEDTLVPEKRMKPAFLDKSHPESDVGRKCKKPAARNEHTKTEETGKSHLWGRTDTGCPAPSIRYLQEIWLYCGNT